jgi:hypothetical protein
LSSREAELGQAQQQLQSELDRKQTFEMHTREQICSDTESLGRAKELLANLARQREGGEGVRRGIAGMGPFQLLRRRCARSGSARPRLVKVWSA